MQNSNKKRIAIYYPCFMGGGAEAVGLWILEALQTKHNLTLFTISDVDFVRLNSMYGTSLSHNTVKVRSLVPSYLGALCNLLIANSKALRMLFFHLLLRYFKLHCYEYDVVSSAFNAADLGRPGIQYIHWVNVLEGNSLYRMISGFSQKSLKKNLSIVNSKMVARQVKATYGIDSEVVFPPVVVDAPQVSWEQKENAFICSGRLVKSKQPHKVIQLLKTVRDQGFDVKLHLTGGGGGTSEWRYRRFVKNLAKDNADWVTLHENLTYDEYIGIASRCKYGIHLKREPFGISIAEMVKVGAIPFVRSKGGQIEILGDDNQDLLFDNEKEAVEKIINLLKDSEHQQEIIHILKERKRLFSTEQFTREIDAVFDSYISEKQKNVGQPDLALKN